MINPHKPIVGYPFAAPLSGKDTVEKELVKVRPNIAIIHMSTLLQMTIRTNQKYQEIVQKGGLLPPEEAIKAFRRGFLSVTKNHSHESLPHIFANGACREEYETRSNMSLVRRVKGNSYQMIGFRFLLDKEHILMRAKKRVEQSIANGQKPRPDDLDDVPFVRYQTFQKNLEKVLIVFEKNGGVIVDIDANPEPAKVFSQVMSVYDSVKIQSKDEVKF